MAKQIVQIQIEKTVLDGTEILEMQEAAGGVGSSKKFSLANLASTFLASIFASKAQGGKADTAVQSIVAGDNIAIDNTDSNNPTVSSTSDVASTKQNIFSAQQTVQPYRADISGIVSIDLTNTAKSNTLILTLVGDVSSFELTNPIDGAKYSIWFIQDQTGGHTMSALPSSIRLGGAVPTWTTTAGAIDLLCLDYGSVENSYLAAFSPNR